MPDLPNKFPFRADLNRFIREYRRCDSYWYVPKTRSLSEINVGAIRVITRVIGVEFAGYRWGPEALDRILARARQLGVLKPYFQDGSLQSRTALVRIWKKLLELLGLLWIRDGQEPILTRAGAQFLDTAQPHSILDQQIAKYQYPNPSLQAPYVKNFQGLVPHIFLLQAMRRIDFRLTAQEHDLFLNLARKHDDLDRVVAYVHAWRGLTPDERLVFLNILKNTPEASRRYNRIANSSAYQRAFLTYPSYIGTSSIDGVSTIVAIDRHDIESLVDPAKLQMKISRFKSLNDWFIYYGDPEQKPSWYTYLKHAIEEAGDKRQANTIRRANQKHIADSQIEELERLEIEKGIEDFYTTRLSLIEPGLKLVPNGRQYATPIGRIDLLCSSLDGGYVVIEIKAAEATDAVFGQILRYIGWVHRNFGDASVRGVILASGFPETARYSRIGMLKSNAEQFILFKKHGLNATNS